MACFGWCSKKKEITYENADKLFEKGKKLWLAEGKEEKEAKKAGLRLLEEAGKILAKIPTPEAKDKYNEIMRTIKSMAGTVPLQTVNFHPSHK